MTEKKRIELTRLQGIIAIASFSSGVLIAVVCLFWIPPLGEIASSAISIVSELLVLCGAILGVKASYDVKLRKFQAELDQIIDNECKPQHNL
ncbi:MAG: hypothetical protein IK119_03930 [Bacteroidales bacterium]|nr:hypothetical protein [Bacteroidales bacterium]